MLLIDFIEILKDMPLSARIIFKYHKIYADNERDLKMDPIKAVYERGEVQVRLDR